MNNEMSKAMQRISSLFDQGTFAELMPLVDEGVVTGYGQVDGALVFAFAQDRENKGASIGKLHARKICSMLDMAKNVGAPVVMFLDSSGIRLGEGADAMDAFGEIINGVSGLGGKSPVISAIYGQAGGGLSVISELADFSFMENDATLYINSPDAIKGSSAEKADTSSADYQFKEAGSVDFVGSDSEICVKIRELICHLPLNSKKG